MQKRSIICVSLIVIALFSLQSMASQKSDCEAGVTKEFNALKAANAADTVRDGNMVDHTWGCSECASAYEQCNKQVDAAVLACAQASGFSPTNTCNADREGSYYACDDQQTSCCLSGELVSRCGSLSDAAPTAVANPQKDCLADDYYYINGDCVSFDQALQICKGKYGATGYVSSHTECDQCPKGQIFNGNECATDPSCPGLSNVVYDQASDACVCKKGFVPMTGGGCQESTREHVGLNVKQAVAVTVKAGATTTTTITIPASTWTVAGGDVTIKGEVTSKDAGIKTVAVSPSPVIITQGKDKTITITVTADNVDEFRQYAAVVQWSGYDNKYLYTSYTTVTVNIVQPDTPFIPEPTAETAKKFKELREQQLPDIVTRWQFGDDRAKTLYAKLDQLDDQNPDDLKIMASIVAFGKAFADLTGPLDLPISQNPFSVMDADLFAQTLMKTADHRLKLEDAHKKIQEVLKAGGQ